MKYAAIYCMEIMNINPNVSKEIDAFINKLPDFSKLICTKLRNIIHKSDSSILEDWKWGPNFNCNGMVCGFGAFKSHVTLCFFQGASMKDTQKAFNYGSTNSHNRSIKFSDVKEINEKIIVSYLKEAIQINNSNMKPLSLKVDLKKQISVPDEIQKTLKQNKSANIIFDQLSYTCKKEYIVWLTSAKKEETKLRRYEKFIDMLLDGKKNPN